MSCFKASKPCEYLAKPPEHWDKRLKSNWCRRKIYVTKIDQQKAPANKWSGVFLFWFETMRAALLPQEEPP